MRSLVYIDIILVLYQDCGLYIIHWHCCKHGVKLGIKQYIHRIDCVKGYVINIHVESNIYVLETLIILNLPKTVLSRASIPFQIVHYSQYSRDTYVRSSMHNFQKTAHDDITNTAINTRGV